jgi:hypothetical protein
VGYVNALPASIDSYLRWIRWRCYFRNRFNRYLDDPETIHSPLDHKPEGCPNWREVDELRATKRSWFLMDQNTSQYIPISSGLSGINPYQEHTISIHPDIPRKDILYWDLIPLWRLQDRFTPQQRIYNSALEPLQAIDVLSRRQRIDHYLNSDEPKWGGMSDRYLMTRMVG